MKRARIILALALTLSVAPLAIADSVALTPTRVVHYGDLDLTHAEGARHLHFRLRVASRAVCASLDGVDPKRSAAYRRCFNHALSSAVADINQPLLTQYHRSVTGDRTAPVSVASSN